MKKTILLLLILSFASCSYFTKKLDSISEIKNSNETISNVDKINFCKENSVTEIIIDDTKSLNFYKNFYQSLNQNHNFNFVQKAILLSLLEMSKRPDLSSPYARLQVYMIFQGKEYYFDFRPKNLEDSDKMPYLFGLNELNNKFTKSSFSEFISTADNLLTTNLPVGSEWEDFLHKNEKDFLKNSILTKHFFKGDEILTKFETFKRVNLKNVYQYYIKQKQNISKDYLSKGADLYQYNSQEEKLTISCNFDFQTESTTINDYIDVDYKKSHYFGIKEGENAFIATSSAVTHRPFKTQNELGYLFKTRASPYPLPACNFKSPNKNITLISNSGRSPQQHLQHLIAFEIEKIDNISGVNEFLKFSRHLFLARPDRILYESKKGRKSQLDFFLSMNFPLYHVESLGNIFGHAKLHKSSHLIIDSRSDAGLWCKK